MIIHVNHENMIIHVKQENMMIHVKQENKIIHVKSSRKTYLRFPGTSYACCPHKLCCKVHLVGHLAPHLVFYLLQLQIAMLTLSLSTELALHGLQHVGCLVPGDARPG